jgi:type I restriction enzyme, S subunit
VLRETALAEFCETGSGSTPSRAKLGEYYGGTIPWVKSGELREGLVTSTQESVTDLGAQAARLKLVPKGSLLVAMYGATVGRTALLGVDATTNQAICHLRPDPSRADTRYVWFALQAKLPELLARRVGGAQPNISQETIRTTKIWLPSLPEQRRIADILDKADAIRRKRKEAVDLTEELMRSAFFEMFGDPVTNPKGWAVKPLGELADIASGVTKGKNYGDQETVTMPYMRVANVQDGHLVLDEVKTITVSEEEGRRYLLKRGDVLLTEGGDPDKLGRGTVWRDEVPGCIHQNHIFRVRPTGNATAEYLSAIIASERGKRYFLRAAKQTTGIASINMTQLKAFPVLLPPSELQSRFTEFLVKLGVLRANHKGTNDLSSELFSSLVNRAFRGELTGANGAGNPQLGLSGTGAR